MKIFTLCKNRLKYYFTEYINSYNQYINSEIIYYNNDDDIINLLNDDNILIFVRDLSDNIINNFNNIKSKIYYLNSEQLTNDGKYNFLKNIFNKNITILDYSNENIYILHNKYNYKNTIYLPYIYNNNEIFNINKTKDICIITSKNNKYRYKIINEYKLNIDIIEGWYLKRDNILFQYKILLNISAFKNFKIFEIIRCYRCLYNKMIIISDRKFKEELIDYNKHILFVDIDKLDIIIKDVIENYEIYYKKLDLDNIDIHYFDNYIKNIKL